MSGITSVRLRDFRRYHDATFAFDPGTTFLEGENNAGKTSVFYAIEYALFGRAGTTLRPADLLRPGAKGVGVELCFTGRDGKHYRLQRVHLRPPRSRTKVVGHFTLWVRDDDEAPERYLLSSDFDDLETDLALAVQRALGLGRRGWDLAVHLRQGHIPDILDGSSQLDRVLGVSASVFVEEELRAMALEREKAAHDLPTLEATRDHLATAATAKRTRRDALNAEGDTLRATLAGLDARRAEAAQALEALAPAQQAADALEDAIATQTTAHDHHERAVGARDVLGPRGVLVQAAEAATTQVAAHDARRTAVRQQLTARREGIRRMEAERGDLAGRLERAEALEGAAACDHCGQAVDPDHMAAHLPKLRSELEDVLARLDAESTEERRDDDALAAANEALAEARVTQAARDEAVTRHDEATAAVAEADAAREQARHQVDAAVDAAQPHAPEGAPPTAHDLLGALRQAHREARDRLLGEQVRLDADQEHAAERLEQVRADLDEATAELADLERRRADTITRCDQLRLDAALATKLRVLGKAFKQVQHDLREQATEAMARRTLALHQHLSGDDRELVDVVVDPKRYVVQVTPRDIGKRVPAGQAQGGGHRLLLGLAARLALAEHIGPVPFVLLDEPTYGLDVARREALLGRIAELDVADQVLLVTHHEHPGAGAQRVRIVREGKTSRPEVSP